MNRNFLKNCLKTAFWSAVVGPLAVTLLSLVLGEVVAVAHGTESAILDSSQNGNSTIQAVEEHIADDNRILGATSLAIGAGVEAAGLTVAAPALLFAAGAGLSSLRKTPNPR